MTARHALLDELVQMRRVVAQRLHRDPHAPLGWRARQRERVPVPTVLGLDEDHRELSRYEPDTPAERPQRDLDDAVVDRPDGIDLVVVVCQEVAGEQFSIDIEGDSDSTDDQIAPTQRRCVREHRLVEEPVNEAAHDEQPRRTVHRPPTRVATEDLAGCLDATDVTALQDGPHQPPRQHRTPARQESPQGEHPEPDRSDIPSVSPTELLPPDARTMCGISRTTPTNAT